VEETIAGCRIWTNHSTGEVSRECPWADEIVKDSHSRIDEPSENVDDEALGCGSLVYDSKELDDMFAYLDSSSK